MGREGGIHAVEYSGLQKPYLIPIRFTYDTKEAGFWLCKVERNCFAD